jgi:hypothetical protein
MSRGPGRIERAVVAILDGEPDNAFTTEDLCRRIYPGANRIEKKHRVAVLRAAQKVLERCDMIQCFTSETVGGTRVYFNADNVMSYAMARLKADRMNCYTNDPRILWWGRRSTEADLRAKLAEGGDDHKYVVEGGAWRKHTQWRVAEIEAKRVGDTARLEKIRAEQEAHTAAVLASLGSLRPLRDEGRADAK